MTISSANSIVRDSIMATAMTYTQRVFNEALTLMEHAYTYRMLDPTLDANEAIEEALKLMQAVLHRQISESSDIHKVCAVAVLHKVPQLTTLESTDIADMLRERMQSLRPHTNNIVGDIAIAIDLLQPRSNDMLKDYWGRTSLAGMTPIPLTKQILLISEQTLILREIEIPADISIDEANKVAETLAKHDEFHSSFAALQKVVGLVSLNAYGDLKAHLSAYKIIIEAMRQELKNAAQDQDSE